MTDQEKNLLAGCLQRDKAAWDAFVLRYSSLVYHTIRKTFGLYHVEVRPDAVEDLFQEFFLALLRDDLKKLRQFRGDRGCSVASWLRVVATRLTIDSLRKDMLSDVELAEVLSADSSDPSGSLLQEELHESLSNGLQTLSSRDRLIVDLYYRQGVKAEEVAAILEASVNAVYTQKSRILGKLREALKNRLTVRDPL
jgi:RNA polymerase sigma-70 factor (ECF subfamily)